MDEIARLNQRSRMDLFEDSAATKRTTPAVVEKDFWVTWVLSKIFSDQYLSEHLVFKGGTSLSKVYKLIERFSEDIDLVLNWDLLTQKDPAEIRSNNQQQKFNQQLIADADKYIKSELIARLAGLTEGVCVLSASDELCVIEVAYPSNFSDQYLSSGIKLEIGPLASMLPSTRHTIFSYAAETHSELFRQASCSVKAINAERTFWEKVLILHQEYHRSIGKGQPAGYSRHFYDVAKMAGSAVKDSALLDIELKAEVIKFKQRYYPRAWARYDLAEAGDIKLVPEGHVLSATKSDYSAMREMFFGDKVPSFEEVISTLKQLEAEINS